MKLLYIQGIIVLEMVKVMMNKLLLTYQKLKVKPPKYVLLLQSMKQIHADKILDKCVTLLYEFLVLIVVKSY